MGPEAVERISEARLYLLFTPDLCRHDPWQTLRAAVTHGVDLVQWRVPGRTKPSASELASCREICAAAGVPLLINDDPGLARAIDAAGAHVGQDDLPAAEARALLGAARWLGISTHDAPQIRAAVADGADYVGFGPCFPTATKGYTRGLVATGAAEVARDAPVPVFAIGGIGAPQVPVLRALGLDRIAGVRGDPAGERSGGRHPDAGTGPAGLTVHRISMASPNE